MEQGGWTLVQIIPQMQLWDNGGMPNGIDDVKFVFHKPEEVESTQETWERFKQAKGFSKPS